MSLRFIPLFIYTPLTFSKESGHIGSMRRSMILRFPFLLIGSAWTFLIKYSWILPLPFSLHLIDLLRDILHRSKEKSGKTAILLHDRSLLFASSFDAKDDVPTI